MDTTGAQHYIECDACEAKPALNYCVTCFANFCDVCRTRHIEEDPESHEIQLLSRKSKTVTFNLCKNHLYREREAFCKSCQIRVCPQCFLEKHSNHERKSLFFGKYEPLPKIGNNQAQKKRITNSQQTECLTTDLEHQYEVRCIGQGRIAILGKDHKIRIVDSGGKLQFIDTDTEEWPDGITVMNNVILYSDYNGRRIMMATGDGKSHEVIKSEWCVGGICATVCGHILACIIYVTHNDQDEERGKVVEYDLSGAVIKEIISNGRKMLYKCPNFINENKQNKDILVSDFKTRHVITVNQEGDYRYAYDGGVSCGRVEMFWPKGLDSDYQGCVIVADQYNHSVHYISKDGDFLLFILTEKDGLDNPMGICFDCHDSVWVAEFKSKKVKCFKYLT